MHPSALNATRRLVDTYIPKHKSLTILDVGSLQVLDQKLNHRELFDLDLCRYIGADLVPGRNVDVVLERPYGLPFDDDSIDVVICGQVFEHIPFFWVTALEFARVVKQDGFIILSAPSRGHVHNPPFDGWRFYADGYRAIADFCDLRCVEVSTDHPPVNPKSGRLDYSGISSAGYTDQYWGDTVGILQKTQLHRPEQLRKLREPLMKWANDRTIESNIGGTQGRTFSARTRKSAGAIPKSAVRAARKAKTLQKRVVGRFERR